MRRPLLAPADQQASRPPILLLADRQLAGRGRNGRQWLSDGQQSLTFSVAIERHANRVLQLGFPLAVGVALAQVLAGHGARPLLKWPNDLYCEVPGGVAKAGGILVEVRHIGHLTRTVVGCGINLAGAPESADFGRWKSIGRLPPKPPKPFGTKRNNKVLTSSVLFRNNTK